MYFCNGYLILMFKEESHLVLWDVLIKTLKLRTSTLRTNILLFNCLPVSLEKTLTVYYFFNQSQNSSSVETSVLCFDWLKDRNLFCAGRLEYCCTKVRFVHKVNGLNLLYGMYLAKPFCGTTIVAAILSRACSIFDEWFRNQLPLKRSNW